MARLLSFLSIILAAGTVVFFVGLFLAGSTPAGGNGALPETVKPADLLREIGTVSGQREVKTVVDGGVVYKVVTFQEQEAGKEVRVYLRGGDKLPARVEAVNANTVTYENFYLDDQLVNPYDLMFWLENLVKKM